MFTAEEIKIANSTSRSYGATAMNKDGTLRAVVPKYVESIARKEDKILDYGAGKGAMHTLYLREKGFDCTAYDFGDNVTELHDKNALDKEYDIVFASNVLNVCSSTSMLVQTLNEIYNATKESGISIINYPSSPRKLKLSVVEMQDIIEDVFKSTAKFVYNTKSAPVWRVNNNVCKNSYKVNLRSELLEITSRYKIYRHVKIEYDQYTNAFIGNKETCYNVCLKNEFDVIESYKTFAEAKRFAKKL